MIERGLIENILSKAVYAPSGDNSQPWHFEVKNDELRILNYPEKDLPFYNYRQCGSLVAHGALVENICILASNYGYNCDISLFPSGNQNELVAKIKFSRSSSLVVDELYGYVEKRMTNRRPYELTKISSETKFKIMSSNRTEGIEVKFVDDREKIKKISLASVINEMTVLKTKQIHNFFFKHVIWSEAEEKEKRSGLFVKTLEMPKGEEMAFRMVRFWPIMRLANMFGITKKIAASNARLFQASPSFISFLSKKDEPEDFFNIGRSLQRIWLACTKENIYAHPITGVLFLYQRVKAEKAAGIEKKQQELIKKSYEEICFNSGTNDQEVLFLLRIGRAKAPSATSSRLAPLIFFAD